MSCGEVVPALATYAAVLIGGGALGAGIGWYGHRVVRKNAEDTNKLKHAEMQKTDIRWAQDAIASGDPAKRLEAIDRLSALLEGGLLLAEDRLTVERVLWRAVQPRLNLPPDPPPTTEGSS